METTRPISRLGSELALAHSGISLSIVAGSYEVRPRKLERVRPFQLPRLPVKQLERLAGVTRCFWRRHRRCMAMLLYLDVSTKRWSALVPPQLAAPDTTRWECRSGGGGFRPGPHLRLAGSLRCLPGVGIEGSVVASPPFDGLHVCVDPLHAWLSAHFVICAGGRHTPRPAETIIDDEYQGVLAAMAGRRIVTVDAL